MDEKCDMLTRRGFAAAAVAATAIAVSKTALGAEVLPNTPNQTIGPFYPVQRLAEEDADLTWIKGHAQRAQGNVIQVSGRVLDRYGNPVENARLEIWQCNSLGRYAHPNDIATTPLDPDFQGFASIKTPIGMRTPHIHFQVDGKSHRLVTQMYFSDDDVSNSKDRLYQDMGDAAARTVAKLDGAGQYRWDIILMDG
jgi:protocatechuate 3,4-dioxygenase, beta subunit